MAIIGYNITDDVKELYNFLEKLQKELMFAIFTTITESFFNNFSLKNDKLNEIDLKNTERGKAFGTHSEVRWLLRADKFHFTFLTDIEEIFNICKEQIRTEDNDILELKMKREHKVILWGERDTKAMDKERFWFEKQIPQKIYYPLENKGTRAELTVVEYIEKGNWKTKFYRFKEVKNV